MNTGDPDFWRWVWLIAMVVFGIGEIAFAGTFFLAPFAIGAGIAAILAFMGVTLGIEWAVFLVVSVAMFLALRPIAHRLDAEGPILGIGSNRQLGQRAQVIEAINGENEPGMVMLGAEKWRAESSTGEPIDSGTTVFVTEVRGTRVFVSKIPQSDS